MPGGWGASLAERYQRTADVRLRGYSGYNTRWALRLLPRLFPASGAAPLLVTVLLGANDANLPPPLRGQDETASRQFVPLDEYVGNLRAILRAIAAVGDGSARVLLITPPPCDEEAWGRYCVGRYGLSDDAEPNRSFGNTRRYAEAVVALGAETGTPTLDLHTAFTAHADWRACLSDGLHPNAAGGRLIGKAVFDQIGKHYPELLPGAFGEEDNLYQLPMDFPDHKSIKPESIDAAFKEHAQKAEAARLAAMAVSL